MANAIMISLGIMLLLGGIFGTMGVRNTKIENEFKECGESWNNSPEKHMLDNLKQQGEEYFSEAKKLARSIEIKMFQDALYRRMYSLISNPECKEVEKYYSEELSKEIYNLGIWGFSQKYAEKGAE